MEKTVKTIILIFFYVQGFAQMNPDSSANKLIELNSAGVCLNDSAKQEFYSRHYINTDSIYCVELYYEIYDWIGVKYKYGKGTKRGTDCSHFVSNVIRESHGYDVKGSSASIYENCVAVKKENLQEGDMVFFRIKRKKISHVGIYLQNGKFAHASVKRGVIISSLDEAYYKKYFVGGGKFKL